MKHRVIIIVCLLIFTYFEVLAVPANSIPFTVKQPDGFSLTLMLWGDENFHCYMTTDHIPVVEKEGTYYYAEGDEDSLLISTGVLAHDYIHRSEKEHSFCRAKEETVKARIHTYWQSEIDKRNVRRQSRSVTKQQQTRNTYTGSKKGLVILVEFANLSMKTENAQLEFDNQFNQAGYSKNGHIGSVHDYFFDQSYGNFDLTFDVVGPVIVSRNYGYYGGNNSRGGDKYPGTMIAEACKLADCYVNFADYDWDGDGEVDQVFVIYAGYGESASGAPSNTIWPHEYNLQSCKETGDGDGPLLLDGVIINTYACSCELQGASGAKMDGMGTACHEFSHCLGFPDLYDTGYNGGFGMNHWDLMDSGCYNGPTGSGEVPCGYSAYERYTAGWLDFEELTEPQIVEDMPCIADAPIAYKITNTQNIDEFFLLENRQNRGWFSYVGTCDSAHGMIITHVDYNAAAWAINKVNTGKDHQRMSIVPADNSYGEIYKVGGQTFYLTTENELLGDPFPGKHNVTEFTNTSHQRVGGLLFASNSDGSYFLNKPVENIRENNGLISFYFMGGVYIPVPQITQINKVDNNSITVAWNAVEEADYYSLELTEVSDWNSPFSNVLLSENLHKFKMASTYDGFTNIAEVLDDYTILPGWDGYKVFTSPQGMKIGASNASGYVTTPFFKTTSGSVTICVPTICYGETGSLKLEVVDVSNQVVYSKETGISNTVDTIVCNVDGLSSSEYKVKVSSATRFYICSMGVYDGIFSMADFSNIGSNFLKPIEKRTIEGIRVTSYTFTDLTALNYQVRIMAYKDIAHSEWSNITNISLDAFNGIEGIPHQRELDDGDTYSLDGVLLRNPRKGNVVIRNKKKFIYK